MIGLAPSAAAAATLTHALGIPCENTAKWLHESHARLANALDTTLANGWGMRAGQLVIVDEASLASTTTLVALLTHAEAAGAKLLLVGDHHQLPAVEAGGAFGLLARKTPVSELVGLWRFRHRWEAHATRDLRHAHPAALDAYARHGRLHDGPHAAMLEAAYQAWLHDRAIGLNTVLLAGDNATVTALNARARTDRILSGQVTASGVALRDGTTAGTGDVIVTRLNARGITDRTGRYVRNGDTWTVAHAAGWGDLYLTPTDAPSPTGQAYREWSRRSDVLVLPAEYVAEHVQLGYATTVHRAQGATTDTCHLITTPAMTREHLYVAMTRGRHTNHAYTPTDPPDLDAEPHQTRPSTPATGRDVLERILATTSTELSATEHHDALQQARAERAWAYRPASPTPTAAASGIDPPAIGY